MTARREQVLSTLQGERKGHDPAFEEMADLAAALCGAPIAAVTMLHEEQLTVVGAHGSRVESLPGAWSLCDVTVRDQRLQVVPSLANDPYYADHIVRTAGVEAYAGAPVYDGHAGPVGTLCVLDTRPRPFTILQVQALVTLAGQVTAMLTLRDRTEQLALASQVLAAAVEQSPVGMAFLPQSGPDKDLITGANPAFCALLGMGQDEIARLGCADITHPDDLEDCLELIERLVAGEQRTGKLVKRFVPRSGGTVWVELTGTIVNASSGEPDQILFHALDITDRQAREAELVSLALQDPLTGLPNRGHLIERLSALPPDRGTVLLYLDLDGFKPVNDRLGHAVGDEVLVRLAERMRRAVRTGDVLCRVGGDEFVAILGPDLHAARGTAARLLSVLAEPVLVAGESLTVGASGGLAQVVDGWELALEAADAAMYRAKRLDVGLAEATPEEQRGARERAAVVRESVERATGIEPA
jgi:diguanylate cyclase (GGDEF)-like protein/PAS domain S-box-containing protein